MKKQRAMLAMLLCLSLLLCSCTSGSIPVMEENAPLTVTLPPILDPYDAPTGDAQLGYTRDATLYFVHPDGTHLIAVTQPVTFSAAKREAESLVRALLAFEGDETAKALGGDVKLQLYGANPVEISRDVATVNLSASALQLDSKDYYIACQAITNTLTELSDIHDVNVEVVDKQLGLDVGATLATGCFQRSVGTDVGASYEQILTQRVQTGQSEEDKRLSAVVSVYFPLSGGDGVMCESRSLTFDSQRPGAMVSELIAQIALGSNQIKQAPAIAGLSDALLEAPIVGDMRETGGRVVTLRFAADFDETLAGLGVTRASLLASLCMTITSFLPNVSGIVTFFGEEMIDGVLVNKNFGNAFTSDAILFEAGLCERAQFAGFLLDNATLYFIDTSNENRLVRTQRPVPYHQARSPRHLLLQLMRGPQAYDTVAGAPLFSGERLSDSDIMGISLVQGALLVNMSDQLIRLVEGLSPEGERLLAYAMTNTLCLRGVATKARYYQLGRAFSSLIGEISWAGDFYPTSGLVTP